MFRRRPSARAGPVPAAAFADEVVGYLPSLYATALRLARNRPDAEDLVQDTVTRALRFRDGFTPGTNLRAWLYTILHNTWRNRRRDRSRAPVVAESDRLDLADVPVPAGAGRTPEQILLDATLDAGLQDALGSLPEAFREAVWLRDVEEFTYAEIARMLDVPMGTVMSRISRGRRLLAERLTAGRAAGRP